MRALRRLVHVMAFAGTLVVGALAVALIVSQTPWFRDWLRRYIVVQAKQYLEGELTIGSLEGNLFYGVTLSDVAVGVAGDHVVAVKTIALDYSVANLVSQSVVLDAIRLTTPALHLERDVEGWNVGRLVKKREREADRRGPARALSLRSIVITDGSVVIADGVGSPSYRLPERFDDVDVNARFDYAPVHFSLELDQLSFKASRPDVVLRKLAGKAAVREDNLYLEQVSLETGESSLTVDGVIEQYLRTPLVKTVTSGRASLPELGRVLPVLAGYDLHPTLNVNANGTTDRLDMDLDVRSEAGVVKGKIRADLRVPDIGFKGDVQLSRLNVGPILKLPSERTDLTGHARFDVVIASAPPGIPAVDRLSGTYAFRGSRAAAMGYDAAMVNVAGSLKWPRVNLDGRAVAYGASAAARGSLILPGKGRPFSYDLRGRADRVDLRRLPKSTYAPHLETDLSIAEYHVTGAGRHASGNALLNASVVEGATFADGTSVEFRVGGGPFAYGARGSVTGLNLQRLGRALEIDALDKPGYDGSLNGRFDVKGSSASLDEARLDATGTLVDASLFGARVREMTFGVQMADRALTAKVAGDFEHLDPARLVDRRALAGRVSGRADGTVHFADLGSPVTLSTISGDGRVTLAESVIGGLQITAADVQGQYASEVAEIRRLQLTGPDVKVDASGRLSLDRVSSSNLKYHVESADITEIAKLAGQDGLDGSVVLDGTLTGNALAMQTSGTLNGSKVAWQDYKALDLNSAYSVTVPELDIVRARVEAKTDATFLSLGGVELNELVATTTYENKRLGFSTTITEQSRSLDATGEVIFHPDHQEAHFPQLAIRAQGIEWRNAPGIDNAIQYGNRTLTLKNVRLVSGNQSLDVAGSIALGENPTGDLQVSANQVDIAALEQLLLMNRGLSGQLNATARITGALRAPAVDGRFDVANGGFRDFRYKSLGADLDYSDRRFVLDATLQQSPGVSITAKGSMPLSLFQKTARGHMAAGDREQVDLRIRSTDVSLGILEGMTTQLTEVKGTMQADVHVTGAGADPHLEGYVDIKGGAFRVPAGGVAYSGLNTRIELTPDRVRLQSFTIQDEHGSPLNVSGEIAVHERQVGAISISLQAKDFEVIDNELGDVGLDALLSIEGELLRPRVVGDIRVTTGRLELDRILPLFYDPYSIEAMPDVVSAERAAEQSGSAQEATRAALARAEGGIEPVAPLPEPKPMPPASQILADTIAIDVQLRIPDNLVVRGNNLRPGGPTRAALGDLNVTFGGDLRVHKEPGRGVAFFGTVNTVRGSYKFQGRTFELARDGTIRFIGQTPPNPIIDITATREIPDTGVEARVRITGTITQPELQLSSVPPLDESDVLALIVFNQPVNELGTNQRATLAATAGGIATGFIATPLGESIGRALDLDLFEITTTPEGDTLGAGITIGQQIGDRVFFKLRQQFGERSYSEFLLEYQLRDYLRVQASAAPETSGSANRIGQRRIERAGLDVIFFFSY